MDVRPETTAAKVRTPVKARAVARVQIAAVRGRMDVKPASVFSDIAGSLFSLGHSGGVGHLFGI